MTETIKLHVLTRDRIGHQDSIFLILDQGKPIELGNGRFAVVWLAATGDSIASANLLAIKFVRKFSDSNLATEVSRWRFFEEMLKTHDHGLPHQTGMVKFLSYGSFAENTEWNELESKKNDVNHSCEYQFYQTLDIRTASAWQLINTIRDENRKARASKPMVMQSMEHLQGEFYSMPAAHGSLEDALLKGNRWSENPLFTFPASPASALYNRLKDEIGGEALRFCDTQLKSPYPDATNAHAQSVAQNRVSGLTLLGRVAQRSLRNLIIVSLAGKLAKALKALHSQQAPSQGFLAHRDLKLGNFLLYLESDTFNVVLADLGFVGGKESVLAGSTTGKMNSREAFALPPGTYPFRAPEQIQPVLEITCECDGSDQIHVRAYTDITIDCDDWIESNDLYFYAPTSETKQPRAKVLSVKQVGSRRFIAQLSCKISYARAEAKSANAALIKAAGQYSDLFSLGAVIYFIATGGRNPEEFWARCASLAQDSIYLEDNIETSPSAITTDPNATFSSCLNFARALCHDADNIIDDYATIRFLQGKAGEGSTLSGQHLFKLKNIFTHDFKGDPLIKHLRRSPGVAMLLRDVAGEEIAMPIMYLILRCMLRGKPDSFVRPMNAEERKLPVSSWSTQNSASECEKFCETTLLKTKSCDAKIVDWTRLGTTASEVFLKAVLFSKP